MVIQPAVGMKVVIRQWLEMCSKRGLDRDGDIRGDGGPCFSARMQHLCGRTATISRVINESQVKLTFDDDSGDLNWAFCPWMFEEKKEEEKVNPDSFFELFKRMQERNPCSEILLKIEKPRASKPPTPKESEKATMTSKRINVAVLTQLCDPEFAKELASYGVDAIPANIREALEKKIAKSKEVAAEAAAEEIFCMIQGHDKAVAHQVEQLRELRRQEERIKKNITRLNRSRDYGHETSNYLPLADALDDLLCGFDACVPESKRDVPEDWKPAAKA